MTFVVSLSDFMKSAKGRLACIQQPPMVRPLHLLQSLQAIGMLDQYAWTVTGLSAKKKTKTKQSAIVLFVEPFMEMTRFREKWLMYRNTCNQLLSIQRQNAMHTYRKEDEKYEARLQYVQAVEELVGDGTLFISHVLPLFLWRRRDFEVRPNACQAVFRFRVALFG